MRIRRLDLEGVSLEIAEDGEGAANRLLVVHGWTGAKEDFADHVEGLAARGWHVAVPDLRGHGGSDQPEGEDAYSLALFAADAVAVADALRWPRFVLLGHSMGGMVAQLVALDHPERVAGLVLMSTGHAGPEGIDREMVEMGKAVVRSGGTAMLAEVLAGMEKRPLSTDARRALLENRPDLAGRGRRNLERSSPAMWLAMVDELLDPPERLERLGGLATPVLVVVGEQDDAFLEPSRRMAAAIPGARITVIAGAGHAPQFEAAGPWREEVVRFLDALAALEGSSSR